MGKYGHFSQDGLEYVITDPHTPRDWANYMWNATYLASVSQHGNGNSLYQNEDGVVTNLFGKQDMREDPRWIYVRDNDTGEFWSAGYLPCLSDQDAFECHHGLGYSVISSEKNGIAVDFRLFVPRKYSGECWTITVRNTTRKKRNISVFTVANIMLDGVNMPYGYVGGLSANYEPKDQMLFFRNTTFTVVDEKYRAFMYCDKKPARWDVSKDYFLGKNRNYAHPEKIVEGKLGNSIASAEYLVGAMQHNFKFNGKGEKTMNFLLGIVLNEAEARKMIRAMGKGKQMDEELAALKKANIDRVQGLTLETPDGDFNRLFSVWLKHQLYLMADWARFYFKGYRDTCQDSAGMSIINAPRALAMLEKALRNQRSDGFCPRAFRVASMDIAAADKHYADSPSWISHATDTLLRETGDLSLLDRVVEYSDKGKDTIWDHNLRAMEFLWNDRGAHGLSLIHYGDWCDLIDKAGPKGKGEGVWMSFALARVLKIVGQIAEWKGDDKTAKLCQSRYKTLEKAIRKAGWDGDYFLYAINDFGEPVGTHTAKLCQTRYKAVEKAIRKHGWDGEYFLYAINDFGEPVGTHTAKEGRIFLNPQSWSMLSGVCTPEEYTEIAEKIEPEVDTPVGPVTCWPGFTKYNPGIGQLSGTPSGFFTNGNVYCHAACFKIAADFEAGRNEKAFNTMMRILPSEEKSEPYAQVNGYVGPSAMRMKRHVSDDPWRTGTVAWDMLNCVDRLLGFKRTLKGFHIAPAIPAKWKTVRYVRPFRGVNFDITVKRGKKKGVTVDGEPIEGDFIPVAVKNRKKTVEVVCTI